MSTNEELARSVGWMREFLNDLATCSTATPEVAAEAAACLAEFPTAEAYVEHAFGDTVDITLHKSLHRAFVLVRFTAIKAGCLTAEQERVQPYVLRHYPVYV
ncbi:MAG: hypothetical protein HXX19_01690 [Rhodoferax sp.]|nr:hypothetical protein [Rhodoferax sp.]